MGEVWAARHRASGQHVALKVLRQEGADQVRLRDALELELRAVALLDHPNIVQLLDFGEVEQGNPQLPPGSPFLVLEYIDGGPLALSGLSWPRVRAVLLDVLDGLAHAHARGLLHRDLKPGNLLMRGDEVVLADFGLASVIGDHRVLEQAAGDWSSVIRRGGTPNYIAPEQIRGELGQQGPWTDLYALGCVAYALVCGRAPFAAEEVPDLILSAHLQRPPPPLDPRVEYPLGLPEWLGVLLSKDPRRRPQTAAAARAGLLQIGDEALRWTSVPLEPAESAPTFDFSGTPERLRRPPTPTPTRASWELPGPPQDWRAAPRPSRPLALGLGLGLCLVRPAPMTGREADRDRLWAQLVAVHDQGRPRLVVLRGSSGVGKSRLADWLAERAAELGAARVFRAHHQEIPGPVDGLGPMLERALRTTGVPDRSLAVHLQLELDLDHAEASELQEVLRGPRSPDRPLLQNDRARWSWVTRVLARGVGPALLVLDGVQWAASALDLCEHVLAAPDAPAVLVVATAREEDLATRPRQLARLETLAAHERGLQLLLGPLDQADGDALMSALLPLEPGLAERLYRRSGGNPLFQVELVGDWVRRGLLRPGPGGLRVAPGATSLEVPLELVAMWRSRIEGLLAELGPAVERPLELAAALGLEVSEAEWFELQGEQRVPGLLRELRDRGLALPSGPSRWRWVHPMLREALLQRASREGRRSSLHLACAELIEEPVRRAAHLVAAGRHVEGAWVYEEAAAVARRSGSSAEVLHAGYRALAALEAGEVPLEDPGWPRLRVSVGMEQLNRNRLAFVDEQLALARPELARPSWRPFLSSFRVMEAWLAGRRGENARIGGLLDEALEAFPDSVQQTSVAATMSYFLRRVGRSEEALALLESMLPEARLEDISPEQGALAQARGTLELGLGHLELARRFLEAGLRCGERSGGARVSLSCRGALGSLARARGDYDEALRQYGATASLERRLGMPPFVTEANVAVLEVLRGETPAAARRFAAMLEIPGLPAVLGARLGVVLGWLAEGASEDCPVALAELLVELRDIGAEPELGVLAGRGVELARGSGHAALAEELAELEARLGGRSRPGPAA